MGGDIGNDRLQHALAWCAKRKAERAAQEIARQDSNSFSGRAGMSRKMASSRQ